MQHIIQEFEGIDSEASLRSFLLKNKFRLADSRSHADQFVLGAFVGTLDGRQAKITHRLLDESKELPSHNQAGNHLRLEMEGIPPIDVWFRGTY